MKPIVGYKRRKDWIQEIKQHSLHMGGLLVRVVKTIGEGNVDDAWRRGHWLGGSEVSVK